MMPYTKKQEWSIERANKEIIRQIRIGMAEANIKNYTELAKMIRVPRSTFYEHIKYPLNFPLKTLHLIGLVTGRPLSELVREV